MSPMPTMELEKKSPLSGLFFPQQVGTDGVALMPHQALQIGIISQMVKEGKRLQKENERLKTELNMARQKPIPQTYDYQNPDLQAFQKSTLRTVD